MTMGDFRACYGWLGREGYPSVTPFIVLQVPRHLDMDVDVDLWGQRWGRGGAFHDKTGG